LQRMALQELRSARELTQADMAEMLDVPQSSICRIEQRADMYLSTLRNYVQALGGVLQIQAIFPDAGAVVISRFGDYEDQPYRVLVHPEGEGAYRLRALPLHHDGTEYSTRALRSPGLMRTLKALKLPEPEISKIKRSAEAGSEFEIGGVWGAQRIFYPSGLIAAGLEAGIDGVEGGA